MYSFVTETMYYYIISYDEDYFDLPLTDQATSLLEKHLQIYKKELREAIQSDINLLQFLHSTHKISRLQDQHWSFN